MNYQTQALDFLAKHGIKFSFKLANTKTAPWGKDEKRNHFVVTFRKGRKSFSADFFGSINDYKAGKTEIDAYSVLACFSSDIYCPDTFGDFCADYGYNEDSREAEKTFRACKKLAVKLNKFFDTEEMKKDLSEIA